MKPARAFTLVELLVVVTVIALLMSILMPVLHRSRLSALRIKCLSNMRNMEVAHWMYMLDWDGYSVNVGLAHGGAHAKEEVAWMNTLQSYYKDVFRTDKLRKSHLLCLTGGLAQRFFPEMLRHRDKLVTIVYVAKDHN